MARIAFLALILLAACRKETPAPATAQPQTPATTTAASTAEPQDLKNANVNTVIPLPPDVVPRCETGSQLNPTGAVAIGVTSFGPKDPIYFSMWLKEAPEGLQVSVKVLDQKNEEVVVVPKPASGLAIATMTVPTLKAGKYKLEGYWGGNVVCEKSVEIRKK